MIDTLIYVMVVFIDTTKVSSNRFQDAFNEADRKFNIEMMRQASLEAVNEAVGKKTYTVKLLDLYRKED